MSDSVSRDRFFENSCDNPGQILSKVTDLQYGAAVRLFLLSLFAIALLASFAAAQDADLTETDDETVAVEAEEESEEVDEIDETGLDEQGFEDADDDFRPTEDIPTDQSIPFPTDI